MGPRWVPHRNNPANGVMYANSEDGNLYAISQSGKLKQNTSLQLALAGWAGIYADTPQAGL